MFNKHIIYINLYKYNKLLINKNLKTFILLKTLLSQITVSSKHMYAKWRGYTGSITCMMKELCKREVWSWYDQRELFSLQKTTIYEFMISK